MSSAQIRHPGLTATARAVLWSLFAAVLIAPAVAMQFTAEVNWGPGDFVAAAGLLSLTGLGLELAARAQMSRRAKLAASGLVVLALLVVWAELAVGLFD